MMEYWGSDLRSIRSVTGNETTFAGSSQPEGEQTSCQVSEDNEHTDSGRRRRM